MGYQSGFLRVIPLLQVDCIRVTHPCAGRRQRYCYLSAAPRLACVRPVASVHPEPGSNSSLYLFFFFIIPSKRHLTELTSFSLLLLYYTCFFNSFNELLSPTAAPRPPRFAKVLQRYCLSLLHSKFFSMFFMLYNITFLQQTVLQPFILKHFFQKKSQYYLSELHLKASSVDNLWGLSLYITTLLLRNYRFLGFFPILFPGTGEKI